MNTTEYFKRTIQAYLEERAMEDELFAAKYDNPDKNIDDCVTYILNYVQPATGNYCLTSPVSPVPDNFCLPCLPA